MGQIDFLICRLISFLIIGYQVILRPVMRPCCRYYPSCSQYALLAIQHFGALKGGWLACRRVCRCHPWAPGGYDPLLSNKENP